jgi:hypothetical protein
MTDDFRLYDEDEETTRGLRELYSAPAAESYWATLEARIMASVAHAESGWWSELGRWVRPALITAAALVIAAGLIVFRTREAARQVAYENVLAAPTPISVEGTARPADLRGMHGRREETLFFLITY